MYIAICDDRKDELDNLTELLHLWSEEKGHSLRFKSFQNVDTLLAELSKEHFTLYFLDIIMPGMNGIEAAREIRAFDDAAEIVFLTTTTGFAYESYSVHAMDYLLKPITRDQLFPILDKIEALEQMPEDAITLKCGSTFIRVPYSQISHVEVNGKHLYFNLTDGSVREIYGTLSEYEPLLLSRPEFMHIHRSYVVNLLSVSELSPAGLSTFSGKNLPVSRRLYPDVQKNYVKMFFSERECIR